MWCMVCNKELNECTCPDIEERLENLRKCPNLHAPTMVDKPLLERKMKKEQPKKEDN